MSLDAIHPCIAPCGQLKLPKSAPGRFFPSDKFDGIKFGQPLVARRANTMDGVSQRLASGRQGRGQTERLLLRQGWLEYSLKKPDLVNEQPAA